MAEQLFTISTVAFVLAIVFSLVAIALWFRFDIFEIINDLSGRTAKRSIELMRENNLREGKKIFRMNVPSGRSKRLTEKTAEMVTKQENDITEKLAQAKENNPVERGETVMLVENLDNGATLSHTVVEETVLLNKNDDTEILVGDDTGLSERSEQEALSTTAQMKWSMIEDVIIVHTQEIIHIS